MTEPRNIVKPQALEVVEQQQELFVPEAEEVQELAPSQILFNVEPLAPIMHPKKFAELTGRSFGVIGGWMDNGYLPTVKVGRYQMINLVLLTENLKKGYVL